MCKDLMYVYSIPISYYLISVEILKICFIKKFVSLIAKLKLYTQQVTILFFLVIKSFVQIHRKAMKLRT